MQRCLVLRVVTDLFHSAAVCQGMKDKHFCLRVKGKGKLKSSKIVQQEMPQRASEEGCCLM